MPPQFLGLLQKMKKTFTPCIPRVDRSCTFADRDLTVAAVHGSPNSDLILKRPTVVILMAHGLMLCTISLWHNLGILQQRQGCFTLPYWDWSLRRRSSFLRRRVLCTSRQLRERRSVLLSPRHQKVQSKVDSLQKTTLSTSLSKPMTCSLLLRGLLNGD